MATVSEKILPHFHIPLQSGSDKILGLMRRRYTREVFQDRVNTIRQMMPFAGIGADIIVGFPGESPSDFEDTFSFLDGLPLSYLHVFTFSERPDTVAEKLPAKVSSAEKTQRSKRLITLSEKKTLDFNKLNIGRTTIVLFEKSPADGNITGFSSNYIKVEYPWQARLAGQVKRVKFNNISSSGRMRVELIE
jgi:threonylcarbamoyladenosine tRNA methylthiotransferase MtaB